MDSDEESGKDWSDLEEEAMKDDMQRTGDFNDEYSSSKKGKNEYSSSKKSKSRHSSGKSKNRDYDRKQSRKK